MLALLVPLALVSVSPSCGPRPAEARDDPRTPLAERLRGAWVEVGAEEPRTLGFRGDVGVLCFEGAQSVFQVAYEGPDRMVRTPCGPGGPLRESVAIEGDVLVLTYPGGNAFRYRRVDPADEPELFDSVRLDPIELGGRTPGPDEMRDLRDELEARVARDQEVRRRLGPLLQVPPEERGLDALDALGDEMRAVDLDNTRFLVGLLRDVGWIDVGRFGADARHDAFLIVQHSPSLRLMGTVLPILEEEARAEPSTGGPYAYLHDRYQLARCGEQRYGTQLEIGPDGTHYVARLEDPALVDMRRASVGLGPLEEYLDLFRNDATRVEIGEPPLPAAAGRDG